MKKWLILLGIIAILLIGGFLVLSFFAVKLIQPQLQKVMGPGFTITAIKVKPTHLSVKGVRYEDPQSKRRFFQIEEVRIYPSLFSFLKGPFTMRELTLQQPSFFFYRTREGAFIGPWAAIEKKEKGKKVSKDSEKKGKPSVQLKLNRLRIRKGSVDFEDMKTGGSPGQVKLRDLDLSVKDIQYPILSAHSPIEMKGKMKGKTRDGDISTKGWIDLQTTDMETTLKVREIEIKSFEPYYQKRVSAEIDSGFIDMETKIAVKRRMIDAPGELTLNDLRIKEGGGTVLWIPAKTLISLLKDKGNRINIKFHVKGNMDDPKFSLHEDFMKRIAVSLAEALGVPIQIVGETLLKGTGKGAEGLAEGLKSIERIFKKKE